MGEIEYWKRFKVQIHILYWIYEY